jgi:hypothetical protein
MVKYYVEGNIDFFSELYKSLDIKEDNIKEDNIKEDNELCLITNLPLVDKYVTLKCGHKFNYIPLYNDLLNYNTKFIHMEHNKISKKSIRCPYCRSEQSELLPYYEDLGVKKIMGVNSTEVYENNRCEFINEYIINGETKKIQCNKSCIHSVSFWNIPNCSKKYCYEHKKKVFQEYRKKLIQEKKEKEKEEKKKLKQDEKLKKQLEKMKQKEEVKLKKQMDKNIKQDISNNIVLSENLCIAIMKSGAKKGTQCGCKIYQNNICKRHYNLQNKPTDGKFDSNNSSNIEIDNK